MKLHFKSSRYSHLLLIIILTGTIFSCASLHVKNLGIFGESRKKSVLGQDGCTSITLDGIMMWTFGDTILGKWKGELSVDSTFEENAVMKGMISNSLAFTEIPTEDNVENLNFHFYRENGKVVKFIKPRPGENPSRWRFWAIDGIKIKNTVYVYYMIINIDKKYVNENPGALPIRVRGIGLARWIKPPQWKTGDPVKFKRLGKLFYEGEALYGDCVLRKDGYLFLIGHGKPVKKRISAFIARVKIPGITRRNNYEYLDDRGRWVKNPARAAGFFHDVLGELSLSYNEILKKYVIIFCGQDQKIKIAMFNDFKNLKHAQPRVIYVPGKLKKKKSGKKIFYYSGKEIFHTSKAIYAIYIHPGIYQPILLRIPYGALKNYYK